MKVVASWIRTTIAVASCAVATNATLQRSSVFHPYHVSLEQLVNPQEFETIRQDFLRALTEVGMLTIRGIPGLHKQDMFESLQPCIQTSMATQEKILRDGTRRQTLATHSAEGIQKAILLDEDQCQDFAQVSDGFRTAAGVATKAFAARLASVLREDSHDDTTDSGKPLLVTRDGDAFHTLLDVVQNGEHLEHFHSYQAPTSTSSIRKNDETIEWHLDQGLFIIFTPATLVRTSSSQRSSIQGLTDGFYIQLGDGSKAEVEFSSEDDLVILLGDGFNQYINPHYSETLRAVPHALSMTSHQTNEARVWYGRMVLPNTQAVHPLHNQTFGHLRELVVDKATPEDEVITMACSSRAKSRSLETTICEEGTLLCWHECMSLEEHGVSEEICAEQGLDLWCINPRRQLWDFAHGDFFPGCIDAANAENATELPRLPNYPRDEETACTVESFQRFLQEEATYEHSLNLNDVSVLEWTVLESNVIRGRLAYNGLFGYLALGYPSVGGSKNGMHGAEIIMAVPGGNYDAAVGFDLTIEPSIREYMIHPEKSAFRFWAETSASTLSSASSRNTSMDELYGLDYNDCFTAITFETTGFHGKPFNVSGMDHFIWAANGEDYFAGYHTHRGHIYVNWLDGTGSDQYDSSGQSPTVTSSAFSLSFGVVFGITVFASGMLPAMMMIQW